MRRKQRSVKKREISSLVPPTLLESIHTERTEQDSTLGQDPTSPKKK